VFLGYFDFNPISAKLGLKGVTIKCQVTEKFGYFYFHDSVEDWIYLNSLALKHNPKFKAYLENFFYIS